jgi:hypothetical protein
MRARYLLSAIAALTLAAACGSSNVGGEGGDRADSGVGLDSGPGADAAATSQTCSIIPSNSGCEIGEACDLAPDPDAWPACRPFVPDARTTTLCAADEECDSGWTCEDPFKNGLRHCMQFCDANSDCSSNHCETGWLEGNLPEMLGLCSDGCTLVDAEGCPAGANCAALAKSGEVVTSQCGPAGTGRVGDACTDFRDCRPGRMCVGQEGARVCKRWCSIVDPVCGGGNSCKTTTPKVVLKGIEYGVCD